MDIVLQTSKGKATYQWSMGKGGSMYLISFNDGRELWTNSMRIIKDELSGSVSDPVQLTLFDQ